MVIRLFLLWSRHVGRSSVRDRPGKLLRSVEGLVDEAPVLATAALLRTAHISNVGSGLFVCSAPLKAIRRRRNRRAVGRRSSRRVPTCRTKQLQPAKRRGSLPQPLSDRQAMAAPAVAAPSLFGLVVSGRPVSTAFAEVVPASRYTCLVPDPSTAEFLTLFLLPGLSFPPDKGITVMASLDSPSFSEWTTLGVLTPSQPSATFRTGWPSLPGMSAATHPAAMLGLAIEPLEAVASVGSALKAAEFDKLAFGELVAGDLLHFLSSFTQVTSAGERVVMPVTAIDTWKKKFSERFRLDPNFLFKKAGTV